MFLKSDQDHPLLLLPGHVWAVHITLFGAYMGHPVRFRGVGLRTLQTLPREVMVPALAAPLIRPLCSSEHLAPKRSTISLTENLIFPLCPRVSGVS